MSTTGAHKVKLVRNLVRTGTVEGSLNVAASTDVGKVRSGNEDSFKVVPELGLLVVSDGMGGHNAGRLASHLVVETLSHSLHNVLRYLAASDSETHVELLRQSVVNISREIWEKAKGQPGLAGMGATLALILFRGRQVFVAHMGDSRAYLYRNSDLTRLTQDHSIIGLLLREGEITLEEAGNHPAKGMLSHYVGMEGEVYPDVRLLALEPGDRWLLCTDGLTEELCDEEIGEIVGTGRDMEQVCGMLIERAKKGAARDNITVVVAEWMEDEASDGR